MNMDQDKYLEYAAEQVENLCRIASPSGFTHNARSYLTQELQRLGYRVEVSRKGSVRVDLGGAGEPLLLAAHVDTLGAMVRSVNAQGCLQLTKIGGYPENYIESENCLVHTRTGREYSGRILIKNPAVHVNPETAEAKRTLDKMEVVLDEKVFGPEDVAKLEISAGDFVSFDPRTVRTASGFIKSRHLDDKASCGVLLALARYLREQTVALSRQVYLLFTVYEEVGHGGASGLPDGLTEMIAVDMGAVGDDLGTDEYKVSICAKDSQGPFDYDVTNRLIRLAKEAELAYSVDIYPAYGSDADVALRAGYDVRHGLIGPGVAASHGYERVHLEGLKNTLRLLQRYVVEPV